MNTSVPFQWSFSAASTRAVPTQQVMCMSWPQACMTPTSLVVGVAHLHLAGVGQAGRLHHRQGVHVGAHQHRRPLAVLQDADDARAADLLRHLEAEAFSSLAIRAAVCSSCSDNSGWVCRCLYSVSRSPYSAATRFSTASARSFKAAEGGSAAASAAGAGAGEQGQGGRGQDEQGDPAARAGGVYAVGHASVSLDGLRVRFVRSCLPCSPAGVRGQGGRDGRAAAKGKEAVRPARQVCLGVLPFAPLEPHAIISIRGGDVSYPKDGRHLG